MAHLRRRFNGYDLRNRLFGYDTGAAVTIAALFLAFGLLLSAVIYASDTERFNDQAERRERITKLFPADDQFAESNEAASNQRSIVAQQLLYFFGNRLQSDVTVEEIEALQATVNTGDELRLDVRRRDWRAWREGVMMGGGIALLFIMGITFLVYATKSAENHEYLADLPWRRIWPFLFVLFTALPIGLPFYAVSVVRVWLARKRQPANTVAQGVNAETETIFTEPEPARPLFYSAPNAARAMYRSMRTDAQKSYLQQRRRRLHEEKGAIEQSLRLFGQQLRQAQESRNTLLAEIARLEAVSDVVEEIPDLAHLDTEFNRLMRLPGVSGIRVVNDEISLLVLSRLTYHGVEYDLGDWEVRFGVGSYIKTVELRSGVRRDWSGGYPVYRLDKTTFCFGSRDEVIEQNLLKGQYLEAIELAVDSLRSVNQKHQPLIPSAFKEAS